MLNVVAMLNYKFYFMIRARIVDALDLDCADDESAQDVADQCFSAADPAYDAIETWQGLRLVCRRERHAMASAAA
jgi:hypothetical protein